MVNLILFDKFFPKVLSEILSPTFNPEDFEKSILSITLITLNFIGVVLFSIYEYANLSSNKISPKFKEVDSPVTFNNSVFVFSVYCKVILFESDFLQ